MTHDLPFKDFKNTNEIYSEVVLKGNRPKIPSFVSNFYRQLIEKCWSQDPNERPSFDEIVDHLKNNVNFITKNIRKEDYTNYIEFIGKCQLSFDFKHQILKLDDFINAKSKIDENEQKINEIEQSNDQNNNEDLSDGNNRLIQNEIETNKIDVNKNQLIEEFITLKDAKKLMEYLNNECESEKVSSIFDRCYFECPEFYLNLCKEGMKLNNVVAHHKYAVSLIFNDNDAKSQEEIFSNFSEARSHLEESIRRGYNESHFLLARIMHEFFHNNKRAFEIADEGCKKGDKYSACLLGFFVAKGIGTKKNHQKGVSMMLESGANNFYEKFSTDIGIYYINLAKSFDYKKEDADLYKQKAFEFFEKAYKMNKTKATINNYGICFILGIGVSKNLEKAKEIFQIGVSNGDENSKYHLDFILEKSK